MARIAIVTEELPPHFHWSPLKRGPGGYWRGTEEFYVETAEWLARFGHEVVVLYDGPLVVKADVSYHNRDDYSKYPDVYLHCNRRKPFFKDNEKARHAYWTNLAGDRIENHPGYDNYITISKYAREKFGGGEVVGHGVDLQRYRPGNKQPYALFSSSLDRGAPFLHAIWPKIKLLTGVDLICANGSLSDEAMTALYADAAFWLHPCTGIELFCISALKAMASGCHVIYNPVMALPETIGVNGIALPLSKWSDELAKRMSSVNRNFLSYGRERLPTWEKVTRQLEQILLQ